MVKENKELMYNFIFVVVQTVVNAFVGYLCQNNWLLLAIIIIIVNLLFFVYIINYFKKKMREKDQLLQLYRNLGIDGCTEELKGTRFEPRQCMKDTSKYLDFMGVGGNKWIDQDDKIDLFKNMLERVSSANGKVRYLLINPKSESFERLKKLRKNKVPNNSYNIFKKLAHKYPCLEVRLYDDLPSFRLQFVDQEYVAVSRYYIEHELHAKKDFGWKIPHLVVRAEKHKDIRTGEPDYQATLYKSFEQLYQYIWERSTDINSTSESKQ
jgi:hypothetical protein